MEFARAIAEGFKPLAEAYNEGQRMRADFIEQLGPEAGGTYAATLAKALFHDGRNDTVAIQLWVDILQKRFLETWGCVAGGLAPELFDETGNRRAVI